MRLATVPSEAVNRFAEWLAAARGGSSEALGQLLESCRQYLLMVANRALDPDLRAKGGASDLVQETFAEAQQDFARFQGTTEEELLAWLAAILSHNVANFTRQFRETGKRQVGREVPLADAPLDQLRGGLVAPTESPSGEAIAREQAGALEQALGRLDERQRQAVVWRSLERRPFEEVGRLLGCSAEAARKVWARAVERLQEILGQPDEP